MNSEQINTKKSRPTIVSDGACVELGNDLVLDDVTFSIDQEKKLQLLALMVEENLLCLMQ